MLHSAAYALLDRLPELTDRVTALIREHEPAYRPPGTDPRQLADEIRHSLRCSVESLIRPRELREETRRCAQRIGAAGPARGRPLDAVLHAFRLAGGEVWQSLLETASRQDPRSNGLLVHVAEEVWLFVDAHCTLVTDAYRRAERELRWRRSNSRRLLTGELLRGATRVAELPEAAAALGLPEHGRYTVAAVTGPDRTALHGADAMLWHSPVDEEPPGSPPPAGRPDLALVLLGDREPADVARLLRARARTGPDALGLRVRAGVGAAVQGLAAAGEARRFAETALRTATTDGEVALLDESLPAAFVASSPELAAVLTERVLGPVLRLEPADGAVLLDTLDAWLECDGSAQRAGERLHCHRNTVLNRLRRYERLTGRSLGCTRQSAELTLALTARRVLTTG